MTEIRPSSASEVAVLGGGCFWCVEAVLQDLKGVMSVQSGYTGGHVEHPTYEQICEKNTGHIEVVKVEFNPAELSFADLLRVFFVTHDPTTPGRQGNDVGPQYESAIFYQDDEQKAVAEEVIAEINKSAIYSAPIVTQLKAKAIFWPAEQYHNNYFQLHPQQGYCQYVIGPKVAKFRQLFADRRKSA
jgi:peptide-methionine (S)-S-oxide reductase